MCPWNLIVCFDHSLVAMVGHRHVARFVGICQFTTTTTLCQNTYLIIFRTECPIVIIFIYLELTR